MSKFLTKHPKLAIAFNGAAKNMLKRRNLITNGIWAGGCAGFCAVTGALTGLALLPYTAAAAALFVATDGAIGAVKALKAAKKNNQVKL